MVPHENKGWKSNENALRACCDNTVALTYCAYDISSPSTQIKPRVVMFLPNCNSQNVTENTLQETKLAFFSPGFGECAVAMASIQCLLVRLVEPTAQPNVKVTRHRISSQNKYHSNASNFNNSPSPAV